MDKNFKGTLIILVRHGECEGNIKGMFRGRADFPLNERGFIQVQDLAQELKNFPLKHIYTSPLSRARQTAEAISLQCRVGVKIEERFNNIELGSWEGRLKKEIAQEYPKEWDLWVNNPEKLRVEDMETLYDVQKRAKACLDSLASEHDGENIAVVTHRAVLKPLIAACLNIASPYFWKIHLDTASYSLISHKKERGYCLIQLNQNKHLKEYVTEWV
ncbi:phosphoglycerate mutase [Candidatus Atribacteria bacterium RBG_19FT_COMBO_35_14]|uniref:Phosphoglycerate mutase n=1 Tax=Candidatus Sediminicultor quintus TaxID=1797291 RepID=A0A1F5A5M0_9BACT|nr:MAG: phosphoglycerate mutase [Candidatus Atribacteria bacterium RBG_19FT_COMBO_35_14]